MVTKAELIALLGADLVNSRDESAIAKAYSATLPNARKKTEIGVGTILDVMGLDNGNAFLDVIFTVPTFRYIKMVIEKGELDVSLDSVRNQIDQMVAGSVMSAEAGAALKARGEQPANVSAHEIALILGGE